MSYLAEDTIVATATPPGEGGVAIVRLSGDLSLSVLSAVAIPASASFQTWEARKMYLSLVKDGQGQLIDQVLAVYMPGPHSFTGQDIAEIHCHGGRAVPYLIVDLCLAQGARLAQPGEFSYRAFMNGKMDLSQAESLLSLIEASSKTAVKLAANSLSGALSLHTEKLRSATVDIIAEIEASLDYGEEVEVMDKSRLCHLVEDLLADLSQVLQAASEGTSLTEGLKTVLIGPPNAGKSTLWNALIGEEKALVTPYPGTTRDQLESLVYLEGLTLNLIDTAGLHESLDPVEVLGIEKTCQAAKVADLALIMLDCSRSLEEQLAAIEKVFPRQEQIFRLPCSSVIIANKDDLPKAFDFKDLASLFPDQLIVRVSLKKVAGTEVDKSLKAIKQALAQVVHRQSGQGSQAALSVNARQRQALTLAKQHFSNMLSAAGAGMPADCLLLDLHQAASALGEVSGRCLSEDILQQVFSKFCLGK